MTSKTIEQLHLMFYLRKRNIKYRVSGNAIFDINFQKVVVFPKSGIMKVNELDKQEYYVYCVFSLSQILVILASHGFTSVNPNRCEIHQEWFFENKRTLYPSPINSTIKFKTINYVYK